MKIDLIIFDLDGTLVDSLTDLAASVNHAMRQSGCPEISVEQARVYVGDGARSLIQRSLGPENGADAALLDSAYRLFLEHYAAHLLETTSLYPGVLEALPELARCARLCVLSNKGEALSQRILDGLGVARHFAAIYGGDSFPARKPDPGGILQIVAKHGTEVSTALVVGDSSNDVLAGRSAGARTCGVLYGLKPEEVLASAPDFLVHRFSELLDFVTGGGPVAFYLCDDGRHRR